MTPCVQPKENAICWRNGYRRFQSEVSAQKSSSHILRPRWWFIEKGGRVFLVFSKSCRFQKVISANCIIFHASLNTGEICSLTMVEDFKSWRGHILSNGFPACAHTNPLVSDGYNSDCWGFYSVGLFLRRDDDGLLIKIFLNRRDPKVIQEEDKENNVKSQIGEKLKSWTAIIVFTFSCHLFYSVHFKA